MAAELNVKPLREPLGERPRVRSRRNLEHLLMIAAKAESAFQDGDSDHQVIEYLRDLRKWAEILSEDLSSDDPTMKYQRRVKPAGDAS